MDEKFKKYKNDFIKDNFFCSGAAIKEEQYKKYTEDEKAYIYIEKDIKNNTTTYYKKDIFELNDEELNLAIKIKSYELNKKTNRNINTMRNIMLFWLALTIINLVGIFYIVSKIANIAK